MATWQAFVLGLMVALTPSLVVVAALLVRDRRVHPLIGRPGVRDRLSSKKG